MFIALIGVDSKTLEWTHKYLQQVHGFILLQVCCDSQKEKTANDTKYFNSTAAMIDYATERWQDNFITLSLDSSNSVDFDLFMRRPFTLLVAVETTLANMILNMQSNDHYNDHSFTINHFAEFYDSTYKARRDKISQAHINIFNPYTNEQDYITLLHSVNLLDEQRLRPNWDTYFMELAHLASQRSNCMKRRVGAVLTQDKRILSTGYNGTPKGLRNCTQGGCPRCNNGVDQGFAECLCLHAEENALLEAGRTRIGDSAVLYCNTWVKFSCHN